MVADELFFPIFLHISWDIYLASLKNYNIIINVCTRYIILEYHRPILEQFGPIFIMEYWWTIGVQNMDKTDIYPYKPQFLTNLNGRYGKSMDLSWRKSNTKLHNPFLDGNLTFFGNKTFASFCIQRNKLGVNKCKQELIILKTLLYFNFHSLPLLSMVNAWCFNTWSM